MKSFTGSSPLSGIKGLVLDVGISTPPSAPVLQTLDFTDNNDGTPASLALTYTGSVSGHRVYIATGDATISVTAAQLYAGSGGTGTDEFANFAVGSDIDITGLTSASESSVRISAALIKSSDGTLASNVETETVSGLDFTAPAFVGASATPADGASTSDLTSDLTAIFDSTVYAGSGNFYLRNVTDGTTDETVAIGSCTIGTTDVDIPFTDRTAGKDYAIRWDAGVVVDADGNDVAENTGDTLWNFTATAVAAGITFVDDTAHDTLDLDASQVETTVSLNLTGLAEDDLVVAIWASDDPVDLGTSATASRTTVRNDQGWTSVHDGGTNANPGRQIMYKVMGSTPDTTMAYFPPTARKACVAFQAFRGVDTTTPMDATRVTNTTNSTNPDPPSITTVTDGAWVLAMFCMDDITTAASAAPSGYNNMTTAVVSPSNGSNLAIASKEVATAGAENPGVFTQSGSDNHLVCTMALRPA